MFYRIFLIFIGRVFWRNPEVDTKLTHKDSEAIGDPAGYMAGFP